MITAAGRLGEALFKAENDLIASFDSLPDAAPHQASLVWLHGAARRDRGVRARDCHMPYVNRFEVCWPPGRALRRDPHELEGGA